MPDDLDEVTIRTAQVDDAAAIARVHVRSWQEAYESIVPAAHLASLDPETRADEWARNLASAPHDHVRTWIAALEGTLLGFVTVGPSRDEDARPREREIYSMYLDPGTWGHGVARHLVRTVVHELGEAAPLSLWVLAENERARHFFRRTGFQADGTERFEDVGGAELLQVRYRRG